LGGGGGGGLLARLRGDTGSQGSVNVNVGNCCN
jgi:hypothetical protein